MWVNGAGCRNPAGHTVSSTHNQDSHVQSPEKLSDSQKIPPHTLPHTPSVQDLIGEIDPAAKATAASASVSAREVDVRDGSRVAWPTGPDICPHVVAVRDPGDHGPTRQRSPMT